MHFTLEEHQVMVFDTLAALAADHLPMERLVSIFDAPDPYDRPFWEALMGLGMCGMLIPEAHGGSGLEMIDAAVALEALGHAAAPVPFAPHLLAGLVLARSGRAETWLPGLASGEVMGTLALGTGGWRPESWSLAPEGGTLSGTCAFVPAAGADPLVVVGLAGGGLGLVAPGANGVSQSPQDGIDRTRRLVEMRFENTPFTRLSDTPDLAETLLDASLVLQAADSFGGGRRVLEDTTRYAGERSQFGRTIGAAFRPSSTSLPTWRWRSSHVGRSIGMPPTPSITCPTRPRMLPRWPRRMSRMSICKPLAMR